MRPRPRLPTTRLVTPNSPPPPHHPRSQRRDTTSRRRVARVRSVFDEPGAPLADRGRRATQLRSDRLVVRTVRTPQHDPRTQRQCLRGLPPTRPADQLATLLIGQRQLCFGATRARHTPAYNLSDEFQAQDTSVACLKLLLVWLS